MLAGLVYTAPELSQTDVSYTDPTFGKKFSGYFAPITKPLFAPGILYNSIKSGIAVDYPVITNGDRYQSINLSGSGTGENYTIFGSQSNKVLDQQLLILKVVFTIQQKKAFGTSEFHLRL